MFKAVILLTRRDDMSAEQFQQWWLHDHAPLARQLPGLRRAVFNVAESDDADAFGNPDTFDGVSELWFDSRADFDAAYATELGQSVAADSMAHVSKRQRVFVTEHPIVTEPTVPLVRIEPNPRRIRAFVNGVAVADSTRSVYLFEQGHQPIYYLPAEDVRFDLLTATDHTTHCPRKGDASYWSITVGDRTVQNAVWGYPHPIAGCPDISGYVAFYWNRIDNWFEEDDEVFVHARDPYKRVDVLQSSRHVQVQIDGVTVADTHRPRLLFETGLPTRYYIPKLDVRQDLLRPSSTTTRCPYKGVAEYFSVGLPDGPDDHHGAGNEVRDIAWVYPAPIPEIPKIENHLAFFNEKVDIIVDGVPLARPTKTPWS